MNVWLLIGCLIIGGIVGGVIVWCTMQYLIGKAFMDSM